MVLVINPHKLLPDYISPQIFALFVSFCLVFTVHSCAVLVHSHSSHQHWFQGQAAVFLFTVHYQPSIKRQSDKVSDPLVNIVVELLDLFIRWPVRTGNVLCC